MRKAMRAAVLVGILGSAFGTGRLYAAQSEADMGAACMKHCNSEALRSEIEALEKEAKSTSGTKPVQLENRRAEIRKHIAQHQRELGDLQARLDGKAAGTKAPGAQAMYKCPMDGHTSDKPGKCPACGMMLEKQK